MSHPVLWPKKTYFYPIGNTAPVCLTQDLSPEESAIVLLLGCGDPRSILYTVYAGAKSSGKQRTLDFTCCGFEPAVLARNTLLFTLIVDCYPIDHIWNIFYHFKLDDSSLSLLVRQCEKLVVISRDLKSWSTSSYSTFLRVCNRQTLSQLNHLWRLYAGAKKLSANKNKSIIAAFTREFETRSGATGALNFTASRSAGPFLAEATAVLSTHFGHYWRTGTVFSDPADIASATFINPSFTYSLSGQECAVHYGTYPLQSFHLASAFVSTSASKKSSKDVKDYDLVSCAKSQFKQWCKAFKAAISPDSHEKVRIRLFAGDALALCRTLYHCRATSSTSASLFVSAWQAAELMLDGGDYDTKLASAAPTTFNVIDTSNIIDHVGLLNVLIATVPVLSHGPSSTIYTEALLPAGKDTVSGLVQRLCAEIPAISLLFGIAPVTYVSNFTSHSNIHELMRFHFHVGGGQYHERIAWKTPYLGDSVALRDCGENILYPSFDPLTLAKLLFDIYYRMFADEDMAKMLRNLTCAESVIHYHRATFAALLGLVKSRAQTDWALVMDHIFHELHTDRKLIMGSNNYQEFCCQLYIRGIYCVESLRPQQTIVDIDRSNGRFQGWRNVPPVVCLILVVPREKVKVLEDTPSDTLGSPMLQCEVVGSSFRNVFSSIQIVFGSISIQGCGSNASAVLNEDTAGWSGSSSLVVSFWIPSFNLAIDPKKIKISFSVHSTPATATTLTDKLGLQLSLFTVNLMDRDSVHIVPERPHRSSEIASLHASMPRSPVAFQRVYVALDNSKVSTLTVRWDITNIAPRDVLAEAHSEQVSPCVMRVTLGQVSKDLVYLFPIDGKRSKLRIARKSGWIEVVAPISGPRIPGGFAINNFPLLLSRDNLHTIWNVHRINLKHLPVFDASQTVKSGWVNPHVSLALSDRERDLRTQASSVPPFLVDILVHVKDTLHSLFNRATETNARRLFGFTDPSRGGIYTIIFLNQLRLDLASHTLVADTCILPLTPRFLENSGQVLANLCTNGQMIEIVTSGDEMIAWKHLLPVFAERCRSWSHKPTCQYITIGHAPLSVVFEENPICRCGEGLSLGTFSKVPQWKKLAPFVTRAVFSPLFAVSYLESIGGSFPKADFMDTIIIDKICASCGTMGDRKLPKCSRCQETSYCGKACQNADWKRHKIHCKGKQ